MRLAPTNTPPCPISRSVLPVGADAPLRSTRRAWARIPIRKKPRGPRCTAQRNRASAWSSARLARSTGMGTPARYRRTVSRACPNATANSVAVDCVKKGAEKATRSEYPSDRSAYSRSSPTRSAIRRDPAK